MTAYMLVEVDYVMAKLAEDVAACRLTVNGARALLGLQALKETQ